MDCDVKMTDISCRICCKTTSNLLNVFKNELDNDIVSKINVCFGILITKEDNITKSVCKQCFFLINSYSELRTIAINNNIRLQEAQKAKEEANATRIKQEKENVVNAKNDTEIPIPSISQPSLVENPKIVEDTNDVSIPNILPIPLPHKQNIEVDKNKISAFNTLQTIPESPVNLPKSNLNQDNFLNGLKLTKATNRKIKKKKQRYHPSVSKIKIAYPKIRLPRKFYMKNFDAVVVINRNEVYDLLATTTWANNSKETNPPGVYLKKISLPSPSPSIVEIPIDVPKKLQMKTECHSTVDTYTSPDVLSNYSSHAQIENRRETNVENGEDNEINNEDNITNNIDNETNNKENETSNKNTVPIETSIRNILLKKSPEVRICIPRVAVPKSKLPREVLFLDSSEDEIPAKRSRYRNSRPDYTEYSFDDLAEEEKRYKTFTNLMEYKKANESECTDGLLIQSNYACKTFICQTCNKVFDSKKALTEHQSQHQNSLRCFKCSKSFPIVEDLIKHNLKVHANGLEDSNAIQEISNHSDTENSDLENPSSSKQVEPIVQPIETNKNIRPTEPSFLNKNMESVIRKAILKTAKPSTCLPETTTIDKTNNNDAVIVLSDDDDDVQLIPDIESVSVQANIATKPQKPTSRRKSVIKPREDIDPLYVDQGTINLDQGTINLDQDLDTVNVDKNTDIINIDQDPNVVNQNEIQLDKNDKKNNVSDDEFYIKVFFQKYSKKANQQTPKENKCSLKPKQNKVWHIQHLDNLLDKSYIPIEFYPSIDDGFDLKYVYTGKRKTKPMSTSYRWSVDKTTDIPKRDAIKPVINRVQNKPFNSIPSGQPPKHVECVSSKPNDSTIPHTMIIKPTENIPVSNSNVCLNNLKMSKSTVAISNRSITMLSGNSQKLVAKMLKYTNGPTSASSKNTQSILKSNAFIIPQNLVIQNSGNGQNQALVPITQATLVSMPQNTVLSQNATIVSMPQNNVLSSHNVLLPTQNLTSSQDMAPISQHRAVVSIPQNGAVVSMPENNLVLVPTQNLTQNQAIVPVTENNSIHNVLMPQTVTDPNQFNIEGQNFLFNMLNNYPSASYNQTDQSGNVNIQNFVSINMPNVPDMLQKHFTNTTQSTRNSKLRQLLPSTVENINSPITTLPSTSTDDSTVQRPLLRIKNISELVDQNKEKTLNANNRFNLQNMYVQSLSNYAQTNDVQLTQSTDEYIQIS